MRMDAGDRGGSAFGAYVLGLAFAFGWTPCIGPQLGAILSLAAQEAQHGARHVLLGVYALGLGLPVPAGRGVLPAPDGPDGLDEAAHGADRAGRWACCCWTVGLLMLTGGFTDFSYWLLETCSRCWPLPG